MPQPARSTNSRPGLRTICQAPPARGAKFDLVVRYKGVPRGASTTVAIRQRIDGVWLVRIVDAARRRIQFVAQAVRQSQTRGHTPRILSVNREIGKTEVDRFFDVDDATQELGRLQCRDA